MTSEFAVVGGVYTEHCLEPSWFQVYGSGGRAASAVHGLLPPRTKAHLYAPCTDKSAKHGENLSKVFGFNFTPFHADQDFSFSYLHPLSGPRVGIIGSKPATATRQKVSANTVLLFGMMEGTADVEAKRLVYDPQSPSNPIPVKDLDSKASSIAIVCNQTEARKLGGTGETAIRLAKSVYKKADADVVVVKCGAVGACVVTKSKAAVVPPIPTDSTFSIGSGDVFSAVFAVHWGIHRKDPIEAARHASCAVAQYVQSQTLPIHQGYDLAQVRPHTEDSTLATSGTVYLAAPFFSAGERWLINELRSTLQAHGVNVFSPLHDVGRGGTDKVVPRDVEAIEKCNAVLAVLHNVDSGTLFEVGYARALDKPVVGLFEKEPRQDLKMLRGTGCKLTTDIASAVYAVLWQLRRSP